MTSSDKGAALLKVSGLKVAYGGIQAVKGVSFEVRQGELVSLIGANGAGKTTTLKAVTGTLPVADGEIHYLGKSIKGQGAWDLVKQGLVMVPEGRGVFTRMTIVENLQMGAFVRNDKDGIAADIERVFGIFPRLKERATQLAGTMSGGEQQMLAMARALCISPKLLLLDEPTEGLMPAMIARIRQSVLDLKEHGVTTLLVEQRVDAVLPVADRVAFVENGRVTGLESAADLAKDRALIDRYVGI
jgi:branched-chain amino acid transport system ATP-binding protein